MNKNSLDKETQMVAYLLISDLLAGMTLIASQHKLGI